ncbi:MAG: lytic transglycosylase domain-containing protein [Litoreibacter sp.]
MSAFSEQFLSVLANFPVFCMFSRTTLTGEAHGIMSAKATLLILIAGLVISQPVLADTVKPAFGGDFTFKKIKPPKPGTKKRITIQIEPKPIVEPKVTPVATIPKAPDLGVPGAPPSGVAPLNSTMSWFWSSVSPSLGAGGPGRFLQAVEQIAKAPPGEGIATPRLDRLYDVADRYGRLILAETIGTNLSPALVLAVISVESGGRPSVESNKGATGLMQLIKATGERFGVTDRTDPAQNIKGGVAYLNWLMNEFGGDPILALAGYNAGEGAVRKHGGVPPYAETRAYVPKVLAAWRVTRTMCLTQPELVGDGCVFRQRGT